jgi:hypothetical protein
MANVELLKFSNALHFVAKAHANHRRKGAAQEPYVNHLIEVADLVAQATGAEDIDLVCAALLHDSIEDAGVSPARLSQLFGERVAAVVVELSDDMQMPKSERKAHRLACAPGKSREARTVKLADMTSNVLAIAESPPAGWTADRSLSYIGDCTALHEVIRGTSAMLDSRLDAALQAGRTAIQNRRGDDRSTVASLRQLTATEIGQPVHMVYFANTSARALADGDRMQIGELVARSFPSATIIQAEGVYEGLVRPILLIRLRTDSTEAVVNLAQQLGATFQERFVGVEVNGHYVRVYADDTA